MVGKNLPWSGRSHLSWSRVKHDAEILARKIRDTGFEFDKIATISRGGLIPARLMADHFDIKIILIDKPQIPPKTLFVDDIYDTGKTFRNVALRFRSNKNFVYATLVARIGRRYPEQLVYARKTKGTEYVVFPWEEKENKMYLQKNKKNRKGKTPKNN